MKALKIIAVGVVVAVVALFVGAPMIAEWYVFRGDKKELKPLYRDYRKKERTFPADALDIHPPSAETQAAAEALRAAWKKDTKLATDTLGRHQEQYRKAMAGDALELDPSLRADLAQVEPLLDAWRRLVDRPDFAIDVLAMQSADEEGSSIPVPNYLTLQATSKLAALQALADLSEGRTAQALDGVEAVLKSARAHPYDLLITQLIAIALRSIGATCESVVVARCDDPALLRRALENQKRELDGYRSMPEWTNVMVCDYVGNMRLAKQQGIAVPELQPMTERRLAGLSRNVEADYIEKVVLPKAQNDLQRTALLKTQIDNYRYMAVISGGRAVDSKGLLLKTVGHCFADPIFFAIAVPNFAEAQTLDKTCLVRLELLHLETARKLATIERGAPPTDLAALIPDYLDKPLADPFAQDNAPFRITSDTIYSLGPDGADQQAAVSYDPSNGTQSAGDIFFKSGGATAHPAESN